MSCFHTFLCTLLLGACISSGRDQVEAQRLKGIPSERVKHVAFGSSTSVTCSPDSTSSAIDLKWYGPNQYFPADNEKSLIKMRHEMPKEEDGSHSRIYVEPRGSSGLRLFITDIESKDTGSYNCTGIVSSIPSAWSFELQAYVGLTVSAPTEQTLVYGENSKIQCSVHAQPSPEISWHLNAIYINPQATTKYEITPDGLIVYDVTFDDQGIYQCTGTDVKGDVTPVDIRVDVATRPVMRVAPVNTTGIRSHDVTILCSVTSTPPPIYRWYLGTSSNKGTEITSDSMGDRYRPIGNLSIVDVHLEDEQWYWCEGGNKAGKVSGKAYLDVHMIPQFSDSFNVNNTETRQGNKAVMICQSQGKPDPKMKFHRVGYSKPYVNGIQQDDPRIRVYEKSAAPSQENQLIIPREVVIEIDNTTPNDTDNYTCIAENAAGKNQSIMHIIIQHPPNFDLTPPSLFTQCIWEEHPRNVTALLSGYPQPSLSWARSDGKIISADQTAFKMFFEPYWENGRRDEWMANLQINWEVTKGGLDGPYRPVGNYFPKASNNLGAVDFTINVVEADLPGRVTNLVVANKTAQSFTLSALPPTVENCIPVIGFEVLYKLLGTNDVDQIALFPLEAGESMRIDNLNAGASYQVLVYARNQRGRGRYPNDEVVDTLQSTVPEVVEVTSAHMALSNVSHQVVWVRPQDGGEPITQYLLSWRKDGTSDWNTRELSGGSLWTTIPKLQPDTQYELMVQARNRKGLSVEPTPLYTFRTLPGSSDPSTGKLFDHNLPVQIHFLVIIAVVGLLMILVAVDMVCFCSRDWGVLACICHGAGSTPKQMHGDVLYLDGAESRSLTSDVDAAEKTSASKQTSVSVTSAGSRDTATSTHGQDNRTYKYDSQPRMGGDALTSFSVPGNAEKPPPHEYVNTSRLNSGPAPVSTSSVRSEYQSRRPYNTGHPVPQPRVPRDYNVPGNGPDDTDGRYEQPRPNYEQSRPNYGSRTNYGGRADAYRPSPAAANTGPTYSRPYTPSSRYQRYQPAQYADQPPQYTQNYPDNRTSSPAPVNKPTNI